MKYEIIISIAAQLDIEQAIEWYEGQLQGLGERVKQSLYDSLVEIESNPYLSSKRYKEIRIKYIKKFPFGIHYFIEGNKIKIYGFFHMKRNPTKWLERLK